MESKFADLIKLGSVTIAGHKIPMAINFAIVCMWVVMVIILAFAFVVKTKISSGQFKNVPETKFQNIVESLVQWVYGLVENIMGKEYLNFAPLVGTIGLTLIFCNLFSFTGLPQPTANPAVPVGFALVVFFNIHYQAIKRNGVGGWFKMFSTPFKFMVPINFIVELSVPVSLSMRLFGNMFAGLTIIELVYSALGSFWHGIFRIGIPVPLHFFFDLFDGAIQTYVFMMLTMIFIKNAIQHGQAEHH